MQRRNPAFVAIAMIVIVGLILLAFMVAVPKLQIDGAVLSIENEDIEDHEVRVEIIDPQGVRLYDEIYVIEADTRTGIRKSVPELGMYTYRLTLDNGFNITQKGSVEYSTNVGSSEHLEFVILSGGERIIFDGATIA
ncbi:hypothetical protein [Methanococcoides methylutens]|uniref:Uncharacterized protein n=1 Tax=Methanococcoides methylutens MM1 TaxID=1434104 RepID=A0A0E3WZM7_METMT|nr:hypothetical protein [Methanococcoides methylutens]AKB84874.1 hypothetical protein MCMEM_0821 [Methanococcoides methylutens MM1]